VTVRATRLGRTFVAGVILWGVAPLLMAVWPVTAVAFLAMMVIGIGNAHEDASMFTLVPRLVGGRVTGRILGVLELVIAVGVGLGSVIAPRLIDLAGERAGFAVVGGVVFLAAAAYAVPFARVDRSLPQPGPEVQLLRGLPMFAPLPLVVVEQLADSTTRLEHPAGTVVTRQGDQGDVFHVIASGRAAVEVDGLPRPALAPGDCFGEIALLRASPRTATVTAATDLTTYTMVRDAFLRAVAGDRGSAAAADGLAGQRLAADGADGGAGRPR
jgi:MFS family permease